MCASESRLPADWLAQGDLDIQAAKILFRESGPLTIVGFHLQQAVEKYLKGFLLAHGRSLRRIHDLEVLLYEASEITPDLLAYLSLCQRITEYYIEARYPFGVHTDLDPQDIQDELQGVTELLALIRAKI